MKDDASAAETAATVPTSIRTVKISEITFFIENFPSHIWNLL